MTTKPKVPSQPNEGNQPHPPMKSKARQERERHHNCDTNHVEKNHVRKRMEKLTMPRAFLLLCYLSSTSPNRTQPQREKENSAKEIIPGSSPTQSTASVGIFKNPDKRSRAVRRIAWTFHCILQLGILSVAPTLFGGLIGVTSLWTVVQSNKKVGRKEG